MFYFQFVWSPTTIPEEGNHSSEKQHLIRYITVSRRLQMVRIRFEVPDSTAVVAIATITKHHY